MECMGSVVDVAEQLNRLGQRQEGITDVTLCENGCFNLEGVIIEPATAVRDDTPLRKWFRIGLSNHYTADDILTVFPGARADCPGAAASAD
jgi:hypothetical protein